MIKKEIVNFWIDNAMEDLESALIMYNSGKYLYTGFMCQQCIKKVLKNYYVCLFHKDQPYTHNLFFLMNELNLTDRLDEKKLKTLKKLEPLYISTRYYSYKNKISELLTDVYW